jgi:hypothetical protein
MAPAIYRSAYLPDVAAVLEDATILLREQRRSYTGPWGLHNALDRAWRQKGASPEVLDEARDWLLRTAVEWAQSGGSITVPGLVAHAAATVRLTVAEEVCDA